MTHWSVYTDGRPSHTISGDVRIAHAVHSPQLNNSRDILLYLPPSYWASEKRYPVIYMHDGQNLFDAHTSYAGEWGVDETMQQLSSEGIEAIIVGLPNLGNSRISEYNPYPSPRFRHARGGKYVQFISDTLKPIIDRDYRTRPESRSTGIVGSSMGGLISLYAWLAHPNVFGIGGAMSPSLWIARNAVFDHVRQAPFNDGRLYIDIGTRELPRQFSQYANAFSDSVAALRDHLEERGYRNSSRLRYVKERGGEHNEASWARRLPNVLRFLLKP